MAHIEKNRVEKVVIWSLAFRMYHWLLPLLVGYCLYTGEFGDGVDDMEWHVRIGVFILMLMVFRIFWGIWGDETAKFSKFVPSPRKAYLYLKVTIWERSPSNSIGHSPSAALGALALILVITVQAVTGLFATDDILTEGPLCYLVDASTCGYLTKVHHINSLILKLLICAHLGALTFYALYKKENLIPAMVNGKKELMVGSKSKIRAPQMKTIGYALWTFTVAVVIIWLLVYGLS